MISLEASLAAGLTSLPDVARRETGPGWSAAEVEGYLRRFQYRFGPDEMNALKEIVLSGDFDLVVSPDDATAITVVGTSTNNAVGLRYLRP